MALASLKNRSFPVSRTAAFSSNSRSLSNGVSQPPLAAPRREKYLAAHTSFFVRYLRDGWYNQWGIGGSLLIDDHIVTSPSPADRHRDLSDRKDRKWND